MFGLLLTGNEGGAIAGPRAVRRRTVVVVELRALADEDRRRWLTALLIFIPRPLNPRKGCDDGPVALVVKDGWPWGAEGRFCMVRTLWYVPIGEFAAGIGEGCAEVSCWDGSTWPSPEFGTHEDGAGELDWVWGWLFLSEAWAWVFGGACMFTNAGSRPNCSELAAVCGLMVWPTAGGGWTKLINESSCDNWSWFNRLRSIVASIVWTCQWWLCWKPLEEWALPAFWR